MGEWSTRELSEVVELRRGFDLPTRLRKPGPYPVLSAGVTAGWHCEGPVNGPGFVVGRATNLGVPTWSDVDFWPLNTTLYAADFKGNDPKFLYHLFETLDLSGYDSGSVQPMLNRNYIASIEVRVPDPGTQRAIAEVLGALNAKIAANDLVCKTSREFMVATYDVALANGAVTQTIGEVAAIFDGPHATPRKTDTGPWFLSISSLQGGRLALAESAHLSESDFEHWTRRVTPSEGDLLFSYETRLGEAALMPSGVRGCLGRRMALLRPRAGTIGSRVLAQAFRSDSFQRTIRQRAIHGATVDRIPLVVLPSWPIEVPLNSDGQLESTLADIDERVEQADRESASLAQLRDALLPLLMSGKVRVRDVERRVEDAL